MDRHAEGRSWGVSDRAGLLRRCPLFRGLPDDALLDLAAAFQPRFVERDHFALRSGRPAVSVHLLAEGRVKVIRETEDGREAILRVIGPGELFGAARVWGETVYPATAVALEDSVVLRMPARRFGAIVGEQPSLALALVRELAVRLREAESRILELQTQRVERRIARVLLRLANKTGVKTPAGIEIGVPLTRQELADLVGCTLGTVSRTLSAWNQRGMLAAGREKVVLVKPHLLVAIADELG